MYSEGSQFIKKFLSVLKSAISKIYFRHLIFPSVFIKAWLMLIQNSIYCWIETTQIEIEERPQSKFYNNIRDLSIRSFWYYDIDTKRNLWIIRRSFWYHNKDTKRNPRVMLCSHDPINDWSNYLHYTVYLAVMLQATWHTAEGN